MGCVSTTLTQIKRYSLTYPLWSVLNLFFCEPAMYSVQNLRVNHCTNKRVLSCLDLDKIGNVRRTGTIAIFDFHSLR